MFWPGLSPDPCSLILVYLGVPARSRAWPLFPGCGLLGRFDPVSAFRLGLVRAPCSLVVVYILTRFGQVSHLAPVPCLCSVEAFRLGLSCAPCPLLCAAFGFMRI